MSGEKIMEELAWLGALEEAIERLARVRDAQLVGQLQTAGDFLAAAKDVEAAVQILAPADSDDAVAACLVREAREPKAGAAATWGQIAERMGQPGASPQRAFDAYAPGKAARLKASRKRVARHTAAKAAPVENTPLPGLGMAEVEKHFGKSRVWIRGQVEKGLLHSWPLQDENGTPVTVTRKGKEVPITRYYLTGSTLEQAAKELGVTPAEVQEMAARGEIGSAAVLDEKSHKPVGDARWYWPEHRHLAAE